jgi:hypothetical protein
MLLMVPTPEALDDLTLVLALYPAVVPMPFSQFLDPDDSVCRWLTAVLLLALATFVAEAEAISVSPSVLSVEPSVANADPVKKKAHQSTKV